MNEILKALVMALLEFFAKLAAESRKAIEADRDSAVLRRAGSRIRQWMHKSRADSGVKSDQDRPTDPRQDLHPDQGGVGSDGQHRHNP